MIMKKYIFGGLLAFAALLSACKQENKNKEGNPSGLSLKETSVEAGWQNGPLRLYPIVADEALIQQQAALAGIKTLEAAMQTKGFRLTELKQFGREQSAWYNGLTLVNKTNDTVYMMSGDVVTGGNQDRVNEEDLMALPGTIRNIDVFCVEKGRSSYYNPDAGEDERQLAAFRGYYNVASPHVRKAVYGGSQEAVWSAVADVTSANSAASSTSTYAALDNNEAFKAREAEYRHFFKGKFAEYPNATGLIAVINGKIVGAELFGHPQLFQRRLDALLHSYTAEAAGAAAEDRFAPAISVMSTFERLVAKTAPSAQSDAATGRFDFAGAWVHVWSKN